MDDAEKKEIIGKVLPALDAAEVDTLLQMAEQKQAPSGSIILAQGETNRDLYLTLNGSFSAFYRCRVNLTSVAMNIANFPGPGLLGEIHLVLDTTRTATVIARETCDYLYLTKETFDQLCEQHPQIGIKIITETASLIHTRAENTRRAMYSNLISESPSVPVGLARLGRWLGKWTRVSDDIAGKLFGDFEGENFNG